MDIPLVIDSLKRSFIFEGFSDNECAILLQATQPECRQYAKGEVIIHENEKVAKFGLLLSGAVYGSKVGIDGKETIGILCRKDHFFAIEFAASSRNRSFCCYKCIEDAQVCFFDCRKLMDADFDAALKKRIVSNLVDLLAIRNRKSFERMEILEQNSIRARILLYLQMMAERRKKSQFSICLNREEMAAFLGVNRSALSAELSKMKAEGLIDYDKNVFRLSSGSASAARRS